MKLPGLQLPKLPSFGSAAAQKPTALPKLPADMASMGIKGNLTAPKVAGPSSPLGNRLNCCG